MKEPGLLPGFSFLRVIIRLNAEEFAALQKYDRAPLGEDHFYSFMGELCARADEKGEIDIDRDDLARIDACRQTKHTARLDKVLKRPVDEALREFFG